MGTAHRAIQNHCFVCCRAQETSDYRAPELPETEGLEARPSGSSWKSQNARCGVLSFIAAVIWGKKTQLVPTWPFKLPVIVCNFQRQVTYMPDSGSN